MQLEGVEPALDECARLLARARTEDPGGATSSTTPAPARPTTPAPDAARSPTKVAPVAGRGGGGQALPELIRRHRARRAPEGRGVKNLVVVGHDPGVHQLHRARRFNWLRVVAVPAAATATCAPACARRRCSRSPPCRSPRLAPRYLAGGGSWPPTGGPSRTERRRGETPERPPTPCCRDDARRDHDAPGPRRRTDPPDRDLASLPRPPPEPRRETAALLQERRRKSAITAPLLSAPPSGTAHLRLASPPRSPPEPRFVTAPGPPVQG